MPTPVIQPDNRSWTPFSKPTTPRPRTAADNMYARGPHIAARSVHDDIHDFSPAVVVDVCAWFCIPVLPRADRDPFLTSIP